MKTLFWTVCFAPFLLLAEENPIPKNSTSLILGYDIHYSLWYNPNEWAIMDKRNCEDCHLRLKLISLNTEKWRDAERSALTDDELVEIYLRVNQEKTSKDNFKEKLLFSISQLPFLTELQILEEKQKILKDAEQLSFLIKVELDQKELIFFYQILINKEGTVSLNAITSKNGLEKNRKKIEELFNGFFIYQQ